MKWLLAFAAATAAVLGAWWLLPRGADDLPPGVTVRLRDFREGSIQPDGALLPWVLGDQPVSLCLQTPAHLDTSQWEARLTLAGRPTEFEPPRARLETSLCFSTAIPADLPPELDTELCGEVRDRFDGKLFKLPCQRLRYQADDTTFQELTAAWKAALALRGEQGISVMLTELDETARRAKAASLPFLSVQIELISVYFLRLEGTTEALERARKRLASLPDWLADEAAVWWAAQVAYEQALLDLETDSRSAWQHLREADRLCLEVAHPIRFVVRMKQAEILYRVGAFQEAVDRLAGALDDCRYAECNPILLPPVHGDLAWLILLDPRSGPDALERAARSLETAIDGLSASDAPLEVANHLISRAYLNSLQGKDPTPALTGARKLLDTTTSGVARGRLLTQWADLVEGLAALRNGDLEHALAVCNAVSLRAEAPHLTAWARSCAGQVHHARGDLELARKAFEGALLLHENTAPLRFGQASSPRPGRRSDDYYRAAQVAVDRGDAGGAWEILARLDDGWPETAEVEPDSATGVSATGVSATKVDDPSNRDASEREALLRELITLDVPASGARRRQREPMRRSLMERLRELKQGSGDRGQLRIRGDDTGLAFRAVAVGDEILLLYRDPSGSVSLARQTSFPRSQLRQVIDDVASALNRRDVDDEQFRRLMAPLAQALVPAAPNLQGVTTFALHGMLQAIPIAALPLPDTLPPDTLPPDSPRWLGEATTLALYPAGAGAVASPALDPAAKPLFVVDPRANLPSGKKLGTHYRNLFSASRILQGNAATGAAFQHQLRTARWLHVDSHGLFDPAFPELSSLLMADGPVSLAQLQDLRSTLVFANLSGCRTGSWPTTADSGRYGLAGLFARRGATWVIASRTDLSDRLAADFNRAFYSALAAAPPVDSQAVPAAYQQAMQTVRQNHPASVWASIFLLRGERGKQSSALPTPTSIEKVSSVVSQPAKAQRPRLTLDKGGL